MFKYKAKVIVPGLERLCLAENNGGLTIMRLYEIFRSNQDDSDCETLYLYNGLNSVLAVLALRFWVFDVWVYFFSAEESRTHEVHTRCVQFAGRESKYMSASV